MAFFCTPLFPIYSIFSLFFFRVLGFFSHYIFSGRLRLGFSTCGGLGKARSVTYLCSDQPGAFLGPRGSPTANRVPGLLLLLIAGGSLHPASSKLGAWIWHLGACDAANP